MDESVIWVNGITSIDIYVKVIYSMFEAKPRTDGYITPNIISVLSVLNPVMVSASDISSDFISEIPPSRGFIWG